MFIFNYAGERGYSIVSSDTRTGDILAIVENGNFNIADTVGNVLKKFLFEKIIGYQSHEPGRLAKADAGTKAGSVTIPGREYAGYMRNYRGNTAVVNTVSRNFLGYNFNQRSPEPYEATISGDSYYLSKGCIGQWNFTKTAILISPLIQTQWGQGWPFNLSAPYQYVDGTIGGERQPYCHTTVSGCVAIAVAQIMAYHNFPKRYPEGTRYRGETFMETLREWHTRGAMNTKEDREKMSRFIRVTGDLPDNNWGYPETQPLLTMLPYAWKKWDLLSPVMRFPIINIKLWSL